MVSTSYAQNCSNVDISEELGDVRDQGDVGWCFANAASDILSYAYRKELGGKKISAAYTALNYDRMYYSNTREFINKKLAQSPYFQQNPKAKDALLKTYQTLFPHGIGEGGLMYLAIYSSMRNGLCVGNIDSKLLSDTNKVSLMEKLQLGLEMKNQFDIYEKKNGHGWELGAAPILAKIRGTDNILSQISDENLKIILKNSTKDNFLVTIGDILCRHNMVVPANFYQTQWRTSAIKYLDSSGKVQRWFGKKAADWYSDKRKKVVGWFDDHVTEEIDNQITLKNPIGVLYYSTFFDGWNKPINYGSDLHASVVVGRRWIPSKKLANGITVPGQCQFKIRNSWGKGCGGYKNSEISATCEKGHVWVDREKYKKYLYAVTYINPRKIDTSKEVFPWFNIFRDYNRAPIILLEQ